MAPACDKAREHLCNPDLVIEWRRRCKGASQCCVCVSPHIGRMGSTCSSECRDTYKKWVATASKRGRDAMGVWAGLQPVPAIPGGEGEGERVGEREREGEREGAGEREREGEGEGVREWECKYCLSDSKAGDVGNLSSHSSDYLRGVCDGTCRKKIHPVNKSPWVATAVGEMGSRTVEDLRFVNSLPERFFTEHGPIIDVSGREIHHCRHYIPPLPQGVPAITPPEAIVLVGLPGSGKSTYCRTVYAPQGYVIINQDELGSRQACEAKMVMCLRRGRSVVIDRTNVNSQQRKTWVDLMREMKCRYQERSPLPKDSLIKCVHFTASLSHCEALNSHRRAQGGRFVPVEAIRRLHYGSYHPTDSEGFHSIEEVDIRDNPEMMSIVETGQGSRGQVGGGPGP
ncbi:hypothetical protein KIPB_002367 [Kipferlia bialata]|uniref:Zeta toxin domain-containing protein n=1 Tax=Kipferlia bialata TaxID=797122 RepID=A0A9K3CS34_9EUKA|nr:hypothetical protein KIPB_002367 [Kipferlia bialata]|eukprot:g2367.t1